MTGTVGTVLDVSNSGADRPQQKLCLLSDNGGTCIAADLAEWLEERGVEQVHDAPEHPRTQGRIERRHQTLKNRILLANDDLPGQLEEAIDAFVEHDNNHRYDESLGNMTPEGVCFGPGIQRLAENEKIRQATVQNRRSNHQRQAA